MSTRPPLYAVNGSRPPLQTPAPPPAAPRSEPVYDRANPLDARISAAAARHGQTVTAAWQDGHDAGERVGYLSGWRWGAVCGFLAGLCAGALLVAGALQLGLRLGGLLP